MRPDEFDEQVADQLLSADERAEMHHIQHHFEGAADDNERAMLGWRATSLYVGAFKREIMRLRRIAAFVETPHSLANCRCGHGESNHEALVVCRTCRDASTREVALVADPSQDQ